MFGPRVEQRTGPARSRHGALLDRVPLSQYRVDAPLLAADPAVAVAHAATHDYHFAAHAALPPCSTRSRRVSAGSLFTGCSIISAIATISARSSTIVGAT